MLVSESTHTFFDSFFYEHCLKVKLFTEIIDVHGPFYLFLESRQSFIHELWFCYTNYNMNEVLVS